MLVLKAIYEHGQIRLLEPVPEELPEPQEVTVTFDGPPLQEAEPVNPEALAALEGIIGLLNDLTPEEQARFDEAVRRRSPFFGPRTALE